METIPQKCMDMNAVDSFCDCIAKEEPVDPAVQAFCSRAKTDKNVTSDDLADLKVALSDQEEDDVCCEC